MGLRQGALSEQNEKESLRAGGFGGCYSHYFAGGFALRRRRNSIKRYSATPEREFESQFPLLPLDSKNSLQFVSGCRSLSHLHPVSKITENPRGQIWVTVFRVIRGDFVSHGGSRKPFLVFESRQEDKCGQSLLAVNHELLRCRAVLLVEVNRGLLVLLVIGAPLKECSSRWDSCLAWNRGDFGRRSPFIQRVSANRAI